MDAASTPAATGQAVAGSLVFLAVWVLLLKDEWARLPLGRAVGATAGAAAMVALGVLSPSAAYAAINLETLALLTGCMLVAAHMDRQGLYDSLSRLLLAPGSGPTSFLLRASAASAVCSAVITNDASCIILTPLVLRACRSRGLHPAPHLMAVATCANIGSACSPIGNPQNMLIASVSGLSFATFLGHIGLAAAVGCAANVAIIAWVYRPQLAAGAPPYVFPPLASHGGVDGAATTPAASAPEPAPASMCDGAALMAAASQSAPPVIDTETLRWHEEVEAGSSSTTSGGGARAVPAIGAPVLKPATAATAPTSTTPAPIATSGTRWWQRLPPPPAGQAAWRSHSVRILLLAFPIVLLAADSWIGLGWLTVLYACGLCALDGAPPGPLLLAHVDGQLLLFFSGLFVAVAGFNATGVPNAVWGALADAANVRTASGTAVVSAVTVVGSNIVSNVPLVLLMGPKVSALPPADAALAWSLLAWVSTVAGNLTLLGSVANLIVAAKAREGGYELTFREYLRVGLPSTALMCVAGVPLVWALSTATGGG